MYLYLHLFGYLINWTLTAMASMTALTIFPAVVVARCLLCRLCVVSQCVCVCVWLFFLVLLLLFPRLCCASYDLFDSHANILHNFNSLPSSSFTSAAAFSFTFSSGAAAAAVFALASVTASVSVSVSVSVSASLPTSRPFASRARFLASNLLTFN